MQQTEKYKLNLIEPDDPFLPDGLNKSTQKIENALSGEAAARAAGDAALDQRVTVLEGRKITWGMYDGNNVEGRIIPLPFTPKFVIVHRHGYGSSAYMGLEGHDGIYIKVNEGGFWVATLTNTHDSINRSGEKYLYMAFC